MARPKQPSSKKSHNKPNRGVDFKKIKRKLGRKLPPSKNATNTEVKYKAIVLPEQSVATERSGLAVSSRGLTLRELLQQTSHHNSKIRKAALNGIRDVVLKHPSELTMHKIVILEKLRERICDNDKTVRETLYNLLKTVIFPATKEDITRPIIILMMAYVFNAMTHIVIDIQLMAFQFFELIVLSFPSSFFLFADQVILELLLQTGQYLLPNSSLAVEYDSLQYELIEFYSIGSSIKCGPFVNLPNDCQELAISCLYYFSNLSSELLGSLTHCCLYVGLEPATLLQVVQVVDSIFKSGHLKSSVCIGEKTDRISKQDLFQFLNHVGERDGVSKLDTFKSLVHTVCSCFSGIGDTSLVLRLIFNIIGDMMSLKPTVENLWGLLLVIVALVKRPGQCSVEEVVLLGDWLSQFLISSTFSELSHLTFQSDQNSALHYHILPAFSLLYGKNIKLLDHVMRNFNSFILREGCLDTHGADICTPTR